MKRALIVLAGALLLAACGGGSHTIHGKAGNIVGLNFDDCTFSGGEQVVVTNGDGDVIATTELSDTVRDHDICTAAFTVSVPDADFYRFEFGSVEGPTLSRDELEEQDWRVEGFAS